MEGEFPIFRLTLPSSLILPLNWKCRLEISWKIPRRQWTCWWSVRQTMGNKFFYPQKHRGFLTKSVHPGNLAVHLTISIHIPISHNFTIITIITYHLQDIADKTPAPQQSRVCNTLPLSWAADASKRLVFLVRSGSGVRSKGGADMATWAAGEL